MQLREQSYAMDETIKYIYCVRYSFHFLLLFKFLRGQAALNLLYTYFEDFLYQKVPKIYYKYGNLILKIIQTSHCTLQSGRKSSSLPWQVTS